MRPLHSSIRLLVSLVALLTFALAVPATAQVERAGPQSRNPCPRSGAAAKAPDCADLRISLAEFTRLLRAGDVLVIDVRDPASYWRGHLPGALSIPIELVEAYAAAFRLSDVHIVTYCDEPKGEKSVRAATALRRLGMTRVYALDGGFQQWVADGRVVVTQPSGLL